MLHEPHAPSICTLLEPPGEQESRMTRYREEQASGAPLSADEKNTYLAKTQQFLKRSAPPLAAAKKAAVASLVKPYQATVDHLFEVEKCY